MTRSADGAAGDRIILLGTSGGPPVFAHRSHPASAVVIDGAVYLVDCGMGVARQLVRAGLRYDQLRALFVTHHHFDHVGGYGEIVLLGSGLHGVDVLGPPPLAQLHADLLQAYAFPSYLFHDSLGAYMDGAVEVHEVTLPPEGITPVFEDERVRVTATRVYHTDRVADAYAYRLERKRDGVAVVFSGDTTGPHPRLVELARGATVLVHEVQLDEHVPRIFEIAPPHTHELLRVHFEGAHTDAADVPRVAAGAGVPTLVVNHYGPAFVPREEFEEALRAGAAAIGWDGEIVTPDDLDEILLP